MAAPAAVLILAGLVSHPGGRAETDRLAGRDKGDAATHVHIDLDTDAIAKNFRVDLGLVSDPKLTLARLAESLEQEMSSTQKQEAEQRSHQLAAEQRQEQQAQVDKDRARWDELPMPASRFMAELAELAPDDIVVFDEALTTSPDLIRYLQPTREGSYFQTRGGSLGVGAPGALGLKLAHPDRTVFRLHRRRWCHVHDPGAVDRRAPPDRCEDRDLHRILKVNIQQYWQERGLPEHAFPASFDFVSGPEMRFDRIAESMGVPAVRVEAGSQIRPAITRALETDGPFLVDLIIDGEVPDDVGHIKCGQ